jgi:hypothetical protein
MSMQVTGDQRRAQMPLPIDTPGAALGTPPCRKPERSRLQLNAAALVATLFVWALSAYDVGAHTKHVDTATMAGAVAAVEMPFGLTYRCVVYRLARFVYLRRHSASKSCAVSFAAAASRGAAVPLQKGGRQRCIRYVDPAPSPARLRFENRDMHLRSMTHERPSDIAGTATSTNGYSRPPAGRRLAPMGGGKPTAWLHP